MLLLFGLSLFGAEYHGQVKFGGLPLPGATITATQGDKTFTAVSDLQGAYSFPDLAEGNWSVDVEMLCFTPVKQDVSIGSGLPGPIFDLKLLPIDQIQGVAAPAAPSVVVGPASVVGSGNTPAQTTSATPPAAAPAPATGPNGKPLTGKAAVAAAAAAKSSTAFQRTDLTASKTPAATAANAPAPAPEPAPEVTSELSQRAADGFLVNGSSVNGAASPFAQSQAFGNSRKGARSLYNGNFSLTSDNSALNARPFSLTGQDTAKPGRNNETGSVTFGGPVKIPHLITRNGPLFSVSYQWTRNRNASLSTGTMPDAAERTGDFSQELNQLGQPVQIFDPTTGQQFAGNVIPVSRISLAAKALIPYYPSPNFAGGNHYNYQVPLINNQHQDSFRTNASKSFKRKNFVSGVFALQDTRGDNASQFNFLDLNKSLGMNFQGTYRRTYTARFFGTFGYQFSRQSNQNFPFFSNRMNVSGVAGITGNNQDPLNWGPPSLQFNSISGLSDQNASVIHSQTSAVSYASSWSHNRHNITFGGDFRLLQFNQIAQQNPRGTFTFNGASTSQVISGVPVAGTGSDFAGFLLGIPDASKIAFGNADKYFRSNSSDLYFTDDWRMSPGFTLNAGVRWQYGSPVTEKYNRLVSLDVGAGYAQAGPVIANNPKGPVTGQAYPLSLVKPYKLGFQPNIGFSWRPFPASSMVVRGGFQRSYDSSGYQRFASQMAQQAPLSTSLSVGNSAANPLTLVRGFYAPPNVILNTFGVDPNLKVGYVDIWQLAVQRDLPGAMQMLATYNGSKGTHALQSFLPNTYPVGAVNPCPACLSGYTYYTSTGNSTREAGSMQLRRRLHAGFTATATYTFSKSIDDSSVLGGGGNLGAAAQNWLNLRGERGLSSFDQRHLLNVQMQYTSGVGIGGGGLLSGWRGRLAKDWTFVDNIIFGSGLPLTPVYSSIVTGTGVTGTIRASFTGASVYDAPNGLFLNPAAFTAPAAGQWGNASRYSITGPGQFTMAASMTRAFRLSDRFTLNLRIDANNPLNHVTFPNWNTTVGSTQFGLPNSANAMRSVTTNMRLTF